MMERSEIVKKLIDGLCTGRYPHGVFGIMVDGALRPITAVNTDAAGNTSLHCKHFLAIKEFPDKFTPEAIEGYEIVWRCGNYAITKSMGGARHRLYVCVWKERVADWKFITQGGKIAPLRELALVLKEAS